MSKPLREHSNENYWAVFNGPVYYAASRGGNILVCGGTILCDHSNKSYWAVGASWLYLLSPVGNPSVTAWAN